MDFSLFYQLRNDEFKWSTVIFYVALASLVIVVFCYGVFAVKAYIQDQKIGELDKKILELQTRQNKESEKVVLVYKKKMDAFNAIIDGHKISSNFFAFIEKKTLPEVWFSSLTVSEESNEINLVGEAKNMETLSSQIRIFEESKDYVKGITVLNSQVAEQGKIRFTLNFALESKLFAY